MRAGLALAATTLVASPAFAANEEWPGGPKNEFFRALGRGSGKGQTQVSCSGVAAGRRLHREESPFLCGQGAA
jgi:hypothetical protein